MAIEFIRNQPVTFQSGEVITCNDAEPDYIQIVNTTDITQFQIRLLECLGESTVNADPTFSGKSNFWATTGAWSVSNNQACKATGTGSLLYNDIFVIGNLYRIVIVVDSIFQSFDVFEGSRKVGTIQGRGEQVITFLSQSGKTLSIQASKDEDGSLLQSATICINSLSVYRINKALIIGVRDLSGSIVASFDINSNPEYFTFSKDRATVSVDWAALGVSEGCHTICIADPCINTNGQNGIQDTTMCNSNIWDLTLQTWTNPNWCEPISETGEKGFSIENTIDLTTATILSNNITLKNGIDYDYRIRVYSNSTQTTFQVKMGTASGSVHTVSSSFIEEFTGTITANGPELKLEITSGNDSPLYVAGVADFEISLNSLDDFECDYNSNEFNIDTHSCSILLNACSNEDSLGFVFEDSGFIPRIRVEAEKIRPTYPTKRVIVESSNGKHTITRGERKKGFDLKIAHQPEYVLDFLTLLNLFDKFYIDGVRHFIKNDEMELDYGDELTNFATVSAEVLIDGEILINQYEGGEGECIVQVGFIVHPLNRDQILTEPDDKDTVKAL